MADRITDHRDPQIIRKARTLALTNLRSHVIALSQAPDLGNLDAETANELTLDELLEKGLEIPRLQELVLNTAFAFLALTRELASYTNLPEPALKVVEQKAQFQIKDELDKVFPIKFIGAGDHIQIGNNGRVIDINMIQTPVNNIVKDLIDASVREKVEPPVIVVKEPDRTSPIESQPAPPPPQSVIKLAESANPPKDITPETGIIKKELIDQDIDDLKHFMMMIIDMPVDLRMTYGIQKIPEAPFRYISSNFKSQEQTKEALTRALTRALEIITSVKTNFKLKEEVRGMESVIRDLVLLLADTKLAGDYVEDTKAYVLSYAEREGIRLSQPIVTRPQPLKVRDYPLVKAQVAAVFPLKRVLSNLKDVMIQYEGLPRQATSEKKQVAMSQADFCRIFQCTPTDIANTVGLLREAGYFAQMNVEQIELFRPLAILILTMRDRAKMGENLTHLKEITAPTAVTTWQLITYLLNSLPTLETLEKQYVTG